MPVEECGNMLIMTLSYAQKTGDNSLLTAYSSLLDQWTQYLIADSLIPANQLSTDDFAGKLVNQTNLAIKGIVGIAAMAQIANLTGDSAKASNYSVSITQSTRLPARTQCYPVNRVELFHAIPDSRFFRGEPPDIKLQQ